LRKTYDATISSLAKTKAAEKGALRAAKARSKRNAAAAAAAAANAGAGGVTAAVAAADNTFGNMSSNNTATTASTNTNGISSGGDRHRDHDPLRSFVYTNLCRQRLSRRDQHKLTYFLLRRVAEERMQREAVSSQVCAITIASLSIFIIFYRKLYFFYSFFSFNMNSHVPSSHHNSYVSPSLLYYIT
jgi:hypothetical protein